jgi:hypothetical protein
MAHAQPPEMHRREFLLAATSLIVASPACAATDDGPVAMLTAIYRRVSADKGDGGGAFMLAPKERPHYFARNLVMLWAKADAKTKSVHIGPIDFDPIANSRHPLVKAFAIKVENMRSEVAVVAVSLSDKNAPVRPTATNTLHYVLEKMNGHWRIDEISGITRGKRWSLNKLLEDFVR